MRALSHVGLRSRVHCSAITRALLILLARTGWQGEVTNWGQLCFITSVALCCLILLGFFRGFRCGCSFCLSSRFWEELFEVFEQIRSSIEEMRDLRVDVLYRLRFALIGLKNLEKLFIDLWSILESILTIELVNIFKSRNSSRGLGRVKGRVAI
jgi:hypothetical protein